VRQILGLILAQGARQAEPGEFTKRGFLNGKLDLAQAEAVLDLIRARTEKSAQLALTQAHGELSQHVGELREELLDILVQVEAAIDFPEEEIELLQRPQLAAKIGSLAEKVHKISATYDWGRLFREGARVCICGRPNVGKSSLLNALLGADRVIVTPIPGTTRDVIEESINLDGLPVVLWDTAGIRETDDQVERMGVALSKEHLDKADAAIAVIDGSLPLTDEDRDVLNQIIKRRAVIAVNKSDLPLAFEIAALQASDCQPVLLISAKNSAGIDRLKEELRQLLLSGNAEPPVVVTNVRHCSELMRSEADLRRATRALLEGGPPELAAVDLNEARLALEEIVGVVHNDDILERIFMNFCIGK
jgi:tRNA modification GTPase